MITETPSYTLPVSTSISLWSPGYSYNNQEDWWWTWATERGKECLLCGVREGFHWHCQGHAPLTLNHTATSWRQCRNKFPLTVDDCLQGWSHWSGEGAAWTWWRQKWKWIEWSKDQPWQVPVILGTWKCWSYFLVIPIVNELMKYKKVNPNICDSHNRTALWLAAKKKRIDFNLSVNIVHSALGDWHCHQAKRRTTPSTICELSLGVCQRQWQVPGEISWHAVFMSIHIQASDLLSTSLLSFSHFSQKWFFLLYYCYYFHL